MPAASDIHRATIASLAHRLPLAVNTFVWYSPLTGDDLAQIVPRLARWGFDAIELPLENPGDWDPAHARELLTQYRLRSVVGAVFGPGRELTAAPSDVIAETSAYLRHCIDVAAAQGSPMVIGPMYTSVGRTWRMTGDERRQAVARLRESLKPLVAHAAHRGVRLALEPLNRYETSLVNTVEQALEVIDGIGLGTLGLNLDTYHQNIEEKSVPGALRAAGDQLMHLQVCANDRGAPGNDHLPWDEIRDALIEIDFTGMLGIESFTAENESIATAASIWRPLASSQDALAKEGLAFLQDWRAGFPNG
jgi:D-psicose/D-tagatose/L-ribulose 3-epimerase